MAYPYGQPAYGYAPVRKPGAGTAITAGILALLQGLVFALAETGAITSTRHARNEGYSDALPLQILALVMIGCVAGFFLTGAILLFCRRAAGRFLVITAAGTILVVGSIAGAVAMIRDGVDEPDVQPVSIFVIVVFVIELLTLGLAAAGPTARWIAARGATAYPPPYYPHH
ncbi:putative integral membrane protein [Nocardia transvalensis]|uniref:Putative integral membrane protein n=1 Tax=Nocardia transvalensis TaxID=37333 RepID=A0A7W9PDF9_9NOCA|nr:hypothetical protein [Nocardia transvalensis]MBB5913663.1 putative integral membrane protein [Nocardia transvalensis]